jgi:hypothetical protein
VGAPVVGANPHEKSAAVSVAEPSGNGGNVDTGLDGRGTKGVVEGCFPSLPNFAQIAFSEGK